MPIELVHEKQLLWQFDEAFEDCIPTIWQYRPSLELSELDQLYSGFEPIATKVVSFL